MARTKYDDPACERNSLDVIVTNQPEEYDNARAHRSTWVCSDPACVMDAMAWVTRGTGEKAWWRVGTTGDWRDDVPTSATTGVT